MNGKTGLVIYPKMEKDVDGNWQISNLAEVRAAVLGADQPENQLKDLKRRWRCRHGTPGDPRECPGPGAP